MKFTIKSIIDRYNKGEKLKFLFFWSHINKELVITHNCFSQWYEAKFKVEDVIYKTAEHWMMSEKAKLFKDYEAYQNVINCRTPEEAKAIGRNVKGFDNFVWNENKYRIVKQGNIYKFSQNKDLLNFLKTTKDRILVEASPSDLIWGVGMAENNQDITNPLKWEGQNLLGFAIMEVRDELI